MSRLRFALVIYVIVNSLRQIRALLRRNVAHLAGVCPRGRHRAYNANSSSFQKIFAKANLFWNGVGLPSSLAQAPRLSRDSCPNDELIVKREVSAAQYGVALAFCLGHLRHSKLPAANPRAPSSECGASGGCLPEGQTPRLQRQFLLFPKNLCLSKSFLEGGRVLGSLRRLRRRKGSRKSRVGEFCGIKKCRGLPFRQAPASIFYIRESIFIRLNTSRPCRRLRVRALREGWGYR